MRAGVLTTSDTEFEWQFNAEKMDWHSARKSCNRWGGELASVHSQAQINELDRLNGNERAWIGGHDVTKEGRWEWSDGSKFDSSAWNRGDPNDWGNGEDCLETYGNGKWNDMRCNHEAAYICKRDIGAVPPPPYAIINPSEDQRVYSSIWGKNNIGTGHARSMIDSD